MPFGPVPIVWPDGANSTTIYSTLSTPGFTSGEATAINADSAIIGYAFSGTTAHAFRWKQSGNIWPTPEDLNFLSPSGVQTYAYAIADDGSIAGKTRPSSTAPFHAFKTAGQPFDLSSETIDMGTMGGTASEASDMNELKGTVGRSQLTNGVWRAFLLPISAPNLANSAIYEICGLPGVNRTDWSSAAYGVNKFGQVVGYSQIEDLNHNLIPRAVLYSDQTGVTIDLNNITLDCGQTPAGLGWTLTQAQAINDNDVIVGYGSLSGRSTAWILYPKFQD